MFLNNLKNKNFLYFKNIYKFWDFMTNFKESFEKIQSEVEY